MSKPKENRISRKTIMTEEDALIDLRRHPIKAEWYEGKKHLPLSSLYSDEFEILCFLMLLKEKKEGEKVFYYGKTKDAGRDIVRVFQNDEMELIQCKNHSGTINPSDIKKELSKVCKNIFIKSIPIVPKNIVFYVSTDLTSDAQDFMRNRESWITAVPYLYKDIKNQQQKRDLIDYALTWWPNPTYRQGFLISQEVRKYQDLLDSFFSLKKVVDIEETIKLRVAEQKQLEAAESLKKATENFNKISVLPMCQKGSAEIGLLIEETERRNPKIEIQYKQTSSRKEYSIFAKKDAGPVTMGALQLPIEKARELMEQGKEVHLTEGEFVWERALDLSPLGFENGNLKEIKLIPEMPEKEIPARIYCLIGGKKIAEIPFCKFKTTRNGTKETESPIYGEQLAGKIHVEINTDLKRINISMINDAFSGMPLEKVLVWMKLCRAFNRDGKFVVEALEKNTPSFLPLRNRKVPKQWRQDELYLSCLKTINDEFKLGILTPGKYNESDMEDALFLSKAIRKGRVMVRSKPVIATLTVEDAHYENLPQENGVYTPMVVKWENGVTSYSILGITLPPINQVTILEKATILVSVEELTRNLKALPSGSSYQMQFEVEGLIHEFPKWLKKENHPS